MISKKFSSPQLDQYTSDIERKHRQIRDLQSKSPTLQKAFVKRNDDVVSKKKKFAETEEKLKKARAAVQLAETELQSLKRLMNEAEYQHTAAKTELSENARLIEQITHEVELLEQKKMFETNRLANPVKKTYR